MNPKQEILQILFDSNVFTGNFSELARQLGYTKNSRTTIERIKTGERKLTPKTLDALYEKIYEQYLITESEMTSIADCVAYGKELYRQLREAYGTGCYWHNATLCAMVTEDYSSLPHFDEELTVALKEMKLQKPDIYYGMLSYFYILCNDIFPYTIKGRKALDKQLNGLNETLHEAYPGSNRSYETAKKTIETIIADEWLTILKLIYNLRVIIRWYADDDYFENFLREQGHLLDVGEDSFWTLPGETFNEGCELWYFSVIPTKSHNRGAYTAMKLRAKSNSTESFELTEAYNFMFIIDEAYDNLHLLQALDLPTGKVEYAQFRYNGDERLLELDFEEMPENTFNLPTELVCIDHAAPKTKEEKVWTNIIGKILANQCLKFILQAANSSSDSNIEYLADYEVTNVCIDRKSVTVTIDDGESEKEYVISADAYTFFTRLTANEFASVVRYKDTGEPAIAWHNLGQYIPLKEFSEK